VLSEIDEETGDKLLEFHFDKSQIPPELKLLFQDESNFTISSSFRADNEIGALVEQMNQGYFSYS
jgi:hypothetical protein